MKFIRLFIIFTIVNTCIYAQETISYHVSSPDLKIILTCNPAQGTYSITKGKRTILQNSKLGIIREDEDFTKALKVVGTAERKLKESYVMLNAKKKSITYTANELVISTKTPTGKSMNIIFRVSNDGAAFRYEFPEKDPSLRKIQSEHTSFHFPEGTLAWLQAKAEAQTGFEHTNPSYEVYYNMAIPVGTPSSSANGWVYPALFKTGDTWVMLTEAGLERNYCGTALQRLSPGGEYRINFPQEAEKIKGGALYPESTLPWITPWRIIAIGDLATIMESTLGTDLTPASRLKDSSFVKPGKAAWSWVLEKDKATIYPVQKKYIDYAADMKWQYCLIDANWDQTIGYDSVAVLADYARKKNVGMLLWYNSAGDWNTVKFTPRDKLLTHEERIKEFGRLEEMGIKGIKIDFFGGDGQSMIAYYHDILTDAAAHHLLVNFHGATLPRGLQRTYPNLMTAEAVLGYEMITFGQDAANKAPQHMVASAMIRNVFDPMDFTPMCLYKIPNIERQTTAAFELATAVAFLSGIQHYAETPDGMDHVPVEVKDFLKALPAQWDDVKFIDGYPGKLYVVARKSGSKWYVTGLNGEQINKSLALNLTFLKNKTGKLISSGNDSDSHNGFFAKEVKIPASGELKIDLKKNDGFVAVFE
ncbi:alpha-glucosidase [Pedobacter ginsenosidimutans]|uniref:Alpha-glucosidase n=1 Tax=Pedobacter ginsenosidimutans TaxID=687842 RepID=A0A0T5VKT0_9SPHI|nr:glycoside hydrolase family 97 protein [Pedobacter ginsenosidimutans]KRT14239.1 alpha-glucosidase [Pedobacter ginsenosidimutans]